MFRRIFLLWCVFLIQDLSWCRSINVQHVYPERIHVTRHKRDLSTKYSEGHEDQVSYKINDMILDLQQSDPIHTGEILVRSHDEESGDISHKMVKPEDCHYHGKIRGNEESIVHMSTCDGLFGSIHDGNITRGIEPVDDQGLHKMYEEVDLVENVLEGLINHDSAVEDGEQDFENSEINNEYVRKFDIKHDDKYKARFSQFNIEDQYKEFLGDNVKTRYIEMYACAGHGLYEGYNKDKNKVIERVLAAYTQVDKAYQAIGIRIVIVALEVLVKETFKRHKRSGDELHGFAKYFNKVIRKDSNFQYISMDAAQLLSATGWGGYVGRGSLGGMCTYSSTSINKWSFKAIHGPTVILGHELGHNLNFVHLSKIPNCKCLTSKGCFMGGPKSSMPGFSNCSLSRLNQQSLPCLNNYPIKVVGSVCGNGIKEDGEECDCGNEESCIRNNDYCCEPHGCKLKRGVQCSHFNNPSCCSEQCLFRKQGFLCREKAHTCDVEEYCTGESALCPKDNYIMNGLSCQQQPTILIGPKKSNGVTRSFINKEITAKYLRIVPKKWHGHACFKLQFIGCPSGDLIGAPTTIETFGMYYLYSSLCLSVKNSTCSTDIPDGTPLVYNEKKNGGCHQKYELFSLKSDGSLVHVCSNKKVCTIGSDKQLVISSKCDAEKSKFTRTKNNALQQISSKKCVNAKDGWPNYGDYIVIGNKCNHRRGLHHLRLMTQDCLLDLLPNLENDAFTASSVHDKYKTFNVKYGQKGWCPRYKNKKSFFDIDLGKEFRINYIEMKDTKDGRVYGYNVFFSNDGVLYQPYISSADMKKGLSNCYNGICMPSFDHQCKEIWDLEAKNAPAKCWSKLNTEVNDYGTCSSTEKKACLEKNMYCGQIQCTSDLSTPLFLDYAYSNHKQKYKVVTLQGGIKCSGAAIIGNAEVGLGMVPDGIKCGENKMCVKHECKSYDELNLLECKSTCNGVCINDGKCFCPDNLDPNDGCKTKLPPINGGWSEWSQYSKCTLACGKGTQERFRFCNKPAQRYGGEDCKGNRVESRDCNVEACPIERSCLALLNKMKKLKRPLYDGIYEIKPKDKILKVYCDMTRHGGGWTLIVSSDTNTWTETNVYERNINEPNLRKDYSILKYANSLKDSYLIKSRNFQYMLEANFKDRWGGIWSAPNVYDLASHNKRQTDVKLLKKFDDWIPGRDTINNRVPYVNKHVLTTSWKGVTSTQYGSITDNKMKVHPSYWIKGDLKLTYPEHVWYWVREGDYEIPKSCLDILMRGKYLGKNFKNGLYILSPDGKTSVKSYCDFERYGGGWTLLVQTKSGAGWTKENAGLRGNSIQQTTLADEFSIFDFIDELKNNDPAEDTFEYMIEANGENKNGGIFSYSVKPSLLANPPIDIKPNIIKKFGDWKSNENFENYPIYKTSMNGIFLRAGKSDPSDKTGAIISNQNDSNIGYMKSFKNPTLIKMWIREGGSRQSCNDIAIHGYHKGKTDYKNGFYLIKNNQLVYCDMEFTKNEGWTLLVTSVSNGWTREMVLSRNPKNPSIGDNYSILKHGESIKSLSNGKTFKYMLDAQKRHRWGGVFEAPIHYSLIGTEKRPTKRIQQFDSWKDIWWLRLHSTLPYLGRVSKGRAMLTTARHDNSFETGTICALDSRGYRPAHWINTKRNPGVIWYWLNENDCDSSFKKVDRGLTEWSIWTRCDPCVSGQKKTRRRTCNLIKPRCGGDDCDANAHEVEVKDCEVICKETLITDERGVYCLEPESGKCDVKDGTKIVYRKRSTHCKDDSSKFIYDEVKGIITHKCSKKRLCVLETKKSKMNEADVVISASCPAATNKNAIWRTPFKTLQYGERYCFAPYQGSIRDGSKIYLRVRCQKRYSILIFQNQDFKAPVEMKFYKLKLSRKDNTVEAFLKNEGYKNGEKITGYMDNMLTPSNIDDIYQAKISTFFKAPMTGYYQFFVATTDRAHLYIGNIPGIGGIKNKIKIVDATKTSSGRFRFDKYTAQRSDIIELKIGKKYYLEGLLVTRLGGDYLTVGVKLPDGTFIAPISSHYLSRKGD